MTASMSHGYNQGFQNMRSLGCWTLLHSSSGWLDPGHLYLHFCICISGLYNRVCTHQVWHKHILHICYLIGRGSIPPAAPFIGTHTLQTVTMHFAPAARLKKMETIQNWWGRAWIYPSSTSDIILLLNLIGSPLPCLASGGGATNSPSHVLYVGVSYSC